MLESEFTGSTKIVNYGVEKLRLQQKQKADTVSGLTNKHRSRHFVLAIWLWKSYRANTLVLSGSPVLFLWLAT